MILSFFKMTNLNDEHPMFLESSIQESSDQYECRALRQVDGSADVLPVMAADPEAKFVLSCHGICALIRMQIVAFVIKTILKTLC